MSLSFETFVKFRLVTKAQDLNWNKIQQDVVYISLLLLFEVVFQWWSSSLDTFVKFDMVTYA